MCETDAWKESREKAREAVKTAEGYHLEVYDDGIGNPTVGWGHKLQPADGLQLGDRISPQRAAAFLRNDLQRAERAAADYCPGIETLCAPRRAVLLEMAFCLGASGLAAFGDLRRALAKKNWAWAAAEIQNSRWHWIQGAQLPGLKTRVRRLKRQMHEGKFQSSE